jgi:hypothetical protein
MQFQKSDSVPVWFLLTETGTWYLSVVLSSNPPNQVPAQNLPKVSKLLYVQRHHINQIPHANGMQNQG